MEEEISLFDGQENDPKLDVVKMKYLSCDSLTWKEIFEGYDELYAITFSSGLKFICKLLDLFKSAEIVFGCENVLNPDIAEIIALNNVLMEKIRNSKSKELILNRLKGKSLKLFVAKKQLSHEKIYLLRSFEGKTRVIMGSANMSFNAFCGAEITTKEYRRVKHLIKLAAEEIEAIEN